MLYKVRQFVNEKTLISIYHEIFGSHLNYTSIVWGQTKSWINKVFIIQKKAIRTKHFKGKFDHTSSLFSGSNIIKLQDYISIENCLFISKSLKNQLPEILNNWFVFSSDTHTHTHTHTYIYICNKHIHSLQKQLKHFLLCNLSRFQLQKFLKHHYLKTYQH